MAQTSLNRPVDATVRHTTPMHAAYTAGVKEHILSTLCTYFSQTHNLQPEQHLIRVGWAVLGAGPAPDQQCSCQAGSGPL